jgi:hypothetical protein
MGMDRELSDRPMVFDATGFLCVILEDDVACGRARATLEAVGFDPEHLRVYTSEEILGDGEKFLAQRSTVRKLVGALTDDQATVDLYFGYAAEGRGALWVYAPEKHDASRVMRYLTDHPVLHYRYFGSDGDHDIHVR